jgi:hypothetical protein
MGGLILGSTLFGAAPAGAQDHTLMALVVDYASVRSDILDEARQQTTRIFRESNVELIWLERGDHRFNDPIVLNSVITVHILSRQMADAAKKPNGAMGWAALRTRIVKVFYDGIVDLLKGDGSRSRETASVLAHVIAHEIGHLLIGSRQHSAGGLMQARLDRRRASLGALFFTPSEAQVIQTKLASR